MASRQPKDVNGFVGEREQARGPAGKFPPPGLSHGQPPRAPTNFIPRQAPNFRPEADLAVRRQITRQEIGKDLRVVGPPIIYNPNEMPVKKRSTATLIEKARRNFTRDPGEDIAALASQIASFHPFTSKTPRDTFEDTTSIMTTDTEHNIGDEDFNQYSMSLATDYNKRDPASNPNLKHVSSDHANQMRGQIIPEEEDEEYIDEEQARNRESSVFSLGSDWPEKVAAEKERLFRRHQRPSPDYGHYAGTTQYEQPGDAESNYYDQADDEIDDHEYQGGPPHDWPDEADADAHVPFQSKFMTDQSNPMSQMHTVSRARLQRPLAQDHGGGNGVVESTVEMAQLENTNDQIEQNTGPKVTTMAPPPKPAPATKGLAKGNQVIRNPQFAIPVRSASPPAAFTKTKDTAFGSSSPSPTSEPELALPNEPGAATHKRNLEESLDYARKQLAEMSYDDLDTVPFLADPNELPREPARNQNGVDLTLEERMLKMTDMTEDQCKAMFTSMTDAENEGAGQWFIAKMQEDMENLMVAKHKRRMIALKYEYEIKKRNCTVKAKTEDVESELRGLKNGLGNLMPGSKKDQHEAAKVGKKAAKKAVS